ncbi:MAG: hypothetical protein H0X17_01000 [Deltaproteobacteria bacterium]|nr:hypothetical protein [Deltaproteobacteria bacterium]
MSEVPPELLVYVDPATDPTNQLRDADGRRLTEIVKAAIADHDYATAWPGGLPSASELTANNARAFIVAATVSKVEVRRTGPRASIECTVAIRISPWYGVDGGEAWETATAASATGSARATTGLHEELIQVGVRNCVLEVGETVTTQRILPFLRRVASR